MIKKNVNILGTDYTLKIGAEGEDERFKIAVGITDESIKEIVVMKCEEPESIDDKKNPMAEFRKTMRHEIIHAYLCESGLAYNTTNEWAVNEEMVDWIAIQLPKIAETLLELDVLEVATPMSKKEKRETE